MLFVERVYLFSKLCGKGHCLARMLGEKPISILCIKKKLSGLLRSSKQCPGCFAWTVAQQAPLSMDFSRQEYWSWWPLLPPGDFPDPGIKPVSPALAGRFFTTVPPGMPPIDQYPS